MLLVEMTPNDATHPIQIGWGHVPSGRPARGAVRNTGDKWQIWDISANYEYVGVAADGVSYDFAFILRASGYYMLIDGQLMWLDRYETADPVYAALCGSPSSTGSIDYAVIPKVRWTPTPVIADSFTGSGDDSDGGDLTGIESGGLDETWVGAAWSNSGGACATSTDEAAFQSNTDSTLFRTYDTSSPYAWIEAQWLRSASECGVVAMLDDADTPANFVIAYHNGTSIVVDKCVAGSYTNLASVGTTYSAAARMIARTLQSGSDVELRIFYGDAGSEELITTLTITDSGIKSNTIHGLFSTDSDNACTEAYIYNATGYTALDRWVPS